MTDVTFRESAESAPHLDLVAPDGAQARVYHDGAQVATWTPAGESESRLFVSAASRYGAGEVIRGGIPVIFPQFGTTGALRQHGFVRLQRWTLVQEGRDASHAFATWQLRDSEATRQEWPAAFVATVEVVVGGPSLAVTLSIANTGPAPFTFTAALHPYLTVRDAWCCEVVGLMGTRYRDALDAGRLHDQLEVALPIAGALDRIFFDSSPLLELRERERTLRIEKEGFPDAVVWNPGEAGTAARRDFLTGDEQRMVCVEAAVIGVPITLPPGGSWRGSQRLQAVTP